MYDDSTKKSCLVMNVSVDDDLYQYYNMTGMKTTETPQHFENEYFG